MSDSGTHPEAESSNALPVQEGSTFHDPTNPVENRSSGADLVWELPSLGHLSALLPQYHFERLLGRGGMGAVYLGVQHPLGRHVAIKLLPAEIARDKEFVERFKREARTLANLQHSGIVTVYGFGQTSEGHLYFVMEFVDGMDLHQVIRGPGLSCSQGLDYFSQVCSALQYAHDQGVIHRDIKPPNILITGDGRAKLADFGLARPTEVGGAGLSSTKIVMGTPEYMAPEHILGLADHRSDIYSLGVVLYEMLTGRPPRGSWRAPSTRVVVDARLDKIVHKALQEDPSRRYQRASDMKADVDLIRAPSVPLRSQSAGRKQNLQAAGSSGLTKTGAAPKPSSGSARPRKSSPGLIFGGMAATVVLGIAAFFLPGGRGDKNVTDDAAAPAAAVASSITVTQPKAKVSTPPDGSFENSLGMKFVPVPGTDVLFCIHEVRWKDYAAYAKANPGIAGDWKNQTHEGFVIRERAEDHPVVSVSWEDANAFCAWLSEKEKKEVRIYRLPTDHEWSLAVGIGNKEDKNATPKEKSRRITDEYPWGSEWPPPPRAGNYSDQSRKEKARSGVGYVDDYDDTFPTTAPVMSFKANQFGLYDLGGNVGEWVEDKLSSTDDLRVFRGGSWYVASHLQSSVRGYSDPTKRGQGFRCVVSTGAATKSVEAISVDPPLTAVQPKAPPSVESPQATPADPLADVSGLQTRLNNYLNARNAQLTELATQYSRGLDSRLNQATAPEDLKLTSAYGDEKARVAALLSSLAAPVTDPRRAVRQSPALPELPGDSPGPLVTLRQTWTGESGKILATLEASLQQSLQALEVELTRARDLEKAKAVLAYRESLAASFDLARATKDAPFENSLGMKFVPVPGTNVLMCIHETRRGDYAQFAAQNTGLDGKWISTKDGDNYPVVFVNWHEAQAFCTWLTQKDGVKHRLPTDREWSFAVGIGNLEDEKETPEERSQKNKDRFPWGGSWPPPNDVGNYSDGGINKQFVARGINQLYADGHPGRASVMQFKANQLGIYDLGGNAWEWCEDWHNHTQTRRVMRGSSILGSDAGHLYSGVRLYPPPEDRSTISDFGFRCVIELPSSVTSAIARAVVPPPVPATSAPLPGRASVSASTPTSAIKYKPFENTLGMKFVPVPGTDVLFCIHETRWKDYAAYAKANPEIASDWKKQTLEGFVIKEKAEDHPVVFVNWEEAKAFCAWLSQEEKKEGRIYRLPTDHEWSLAMGIGKKEDDKTSPEEKDGKIAREYPWGSVWPPPQGAGNYSDQSRKEKAPRKGAAYLDVYDDTFPTTAPVMSFKSNPYGLYDLGGNVWELVEDLYSPANPDRRVMRGGSWHDFWESNLLSSNRNPIPPSNRISILGFRCVVSLAPDLALIGRWDCISKSGWKGVHELLPGGDVKTYQNGVLNRTGKWSVTGSQLHLSTDGTDKFELPVVDGKLVGVSARGNALTLTKLTNTSELNDGNLP